MAFSLLIGVCPLSSLKSQDSNAVNPRFVQIHIQGGNRELVKNYDQKTVKFNRFVESKESDLEYALLANGFLSFLVENSLSHDTLHHFVKCEQQFYWSNLKLDDGTESVFRESGVSVKSLERNAISPYRIESSIERGLTYLENNGFPFAKFQFDSLSFDGDEVSGLLKLSRGRLVRIDSVSVQGDLKLRKSYLTNYLNIKEGNLYSEKSIKKIPEKIGSIRFVNQVKTPLVSFQEDVTKVILYLNKRQASSFDGIIGFLPDNVTGDILITGDVKLHLENALKQGEVVDLNWRKLQNNTQELNVELISPFVLNSPFSVDGKLKIYRRDTLFTDVSRQLGARFVFGSADYLRLFVERQTTSLISTSQYANFTTQPPFLDRSVTGYGAGLNLVNVDNRLNPSKGYELIPEISFGTKTIIENQKLPEVIYDSLNLKTLQVRSNINAAYYLKIVPRLIWHQRGLGATLINEQLYNNEAYRIGGLKTLRGFDEESIFATSYFILRSELRYQMDEEGYFFGFFDSAWYENNSLNSIGQNRDTPYGFGAGISFGTRAGVFSLSYALGSQRGNPILIRAAKIHFGFISLF